MLPRSIIPDSFKIVESFEETDRYFITCSLSGFKKTGGSYTKEDAISVMKDALRGYTFIKNFFDLEIEAEDVTLIKGWMEEGDVETSVEPKVRFVGNMNYARVYGNPEPFKEFLEKIGRALMEGLNTKTVDIKNERGGGWRIKQSS